MSVIQRYARDPLIHFLIAGAALFAFFAWRGTGVHPDSRSIEVTREIQASLAVQFERAFQRAPTDAELDGLVDRWVRDEVLYREALRLGLDRDDAVVRRRLAQKMDGIAGAEAETEIPSDEALKRWLADNPERFAEDVRVSFDQLWFESEDAAQTARRALEGGADWQGPGETISLPPSVRDQTLKEVEVNFGREFVDGLADVDPGATWSTPLQSGFGWHLVRLRQWVVGEVPPIEAIRERVENDWRTETIAARRARAYDVLRSAYRVNIEE